MIPAFSLSGVSHRRQGRQVLFNVNLDIAVGRTTCLIGSSGSGKTSLLRLLNRLESPFEGQIRYDGQALESYPVRQLRRRVAFAFQNPVMFEGSVMDNLLRAATICETGASVARTHDQDKQRALDMLELAELEADYADRDAARLSGGEKQRVSLARALMTQPKVLLLDEPTSALDPASAERVVTTLHRLADSGLTIIMATHRMDEVETLDARVVVMEHGRIVQEGGPELAREAAYAGK